VISANVEAAVAALRAESGGGDIWLFGGGSLFASLLTAGLVDDIELAVMPVLLGAGVPLVAAGAPRSPLTLTRSTASPSGIVNLRYSVQRPT
jgi:dihydrofolate reductase